MKNYFNLMTTGQNKKYELQKKIILKLHKNMCLFTFYWVLNNKFVLIKSLSLGIKKEFLQARIENAECVG